MDPNLLIQQLQSEEDRDFLHLYKNLFRKLNKVVQTKIIEALCKLSVQTEDKVICSTILWCLSKIQLSSEVYKEKIENLLSCVDHGISHRDSATVLYGACELLMRLVNDYYTELASHIAKWGHLVFIPLCHPAIKIQGLASTILENTITTIASNSEVVGPALTTLLTSHLLKDMLELFKNKQEQHVLKIWGYVVRVMGINLHKGKSLMNALLEVIERGFKSNIVEVKISALTAWKELIDNFALNAEVLNNGKRLKLLLQALKANTSKTESVAVVRLKTWWHLVWCLDEKLTDNFDMVCLPLLQFCFSSQLQKTKESHLVVSTRSEGLQFHGSVIQGPKFLQVSRLGCEILVRLLEKPRFSSPIFVWTTKKQHHMIIPSLKHCLPDSTFVKHSAILLEGIREGLLNLNIDGAYAALSYQLLHLLVMRVLSLTEEKKTENNNAINDFLEFVTHITKNKLCQNSALLKLLECVSQFPKKILNSHCFYSGQLQVMHGTPALNILHLLCTPGILSMADKNESVLSTFSHLINTGARGTLSPLSFVNSAIEFLSEKHVLSEVHVKIIIELWISIASTLSEVIQVTQDVNQGDKLDCDFSCVLNVLVFPFHCILNTQSEQIKMDHVLNVWSSLYCIFSRCAALVPTADYNVDCEETCQNIENLLTPDVLQNPTLLQWSCGIIFVILSCLDFSSIGKVASVPTSPSKWIKKKQKPLGNLSSLVKLLIKVTNQFHSLEEDKGKQQSEELYTILPVIATDLVKVLKMLFEGVTSSSVIGPLYSKLVPAIAPFYIASRNKNCRSKVYVSSFLPKLENLWESLCCSLQNHYHGPWDSEFLTTLSPLLEATLLHPQQSIREKARQLWYTTFGNNTSELVYPNSFKSVLKKIKPSLVPGFEISPTSEIDVSQSPASQSPTSTLEITQFNGFQSPKKVGSFLKKSAEELERIISPRKSPATKKKTSKKWKIDEMKDEEFVRIDSPPKKRRILTQHQKETLRKKSYVPALYNDLSQDKLQVPFESSIEDSCSTPPIELDNYKPSLDPVVVSTHTRPYSENQIPPSTDSIHPEVKNINLRKKKVRFSYSLDNPDTEVVKETPKEPTGVVLQQNTSPKNNCSIQEVELDSLDSEQVPVVSSDFEMKQGCPSSSNLSTNLQELKKMENTATKTALERMSEKTTGPQIIDLEICKIPDESLPMMSQRNSVAEVKLNKKHGTSPDTSRLIITMGQNSEEVIVPRLAKHDHKILGGAILGVRKLSKTELDIASHSVEAKNDKEFKQHENSEDQCIQLDAEDALETHTVLCNGDSELNLQGKNTDLESSYNESSDFIACEKALKKLQKPFPCKRKKKSTKVHSFSNFDKGKNLSEKCENEIDNKKQVNGTLDSSEPQQLPVLESKISKKHHGDSSENKDTMKINKPSSKKPKVIKTSCKLCGKNSKKHNRKSKITKGKSSRKKKVSKNIDINSEENISSNAQLSQNESLSLNCSSSQNKENLPSRSSITQSDLENNVTVVDETQENFKVSQNIGSLDVTDHSVGACTNKGKRHSKMKHLDFQKSKQSLVQTRLTNNCNVLSCNTDDDGVLIEVGMSQKKKVKHKKSTGKKGRKKSRIDNSNKTEIDLSEESVQVSNLSEDGTDVFDDHWCKSLLQVTSKEKNSRCRSSKKKKSSLVFLKFSNAGNDEIKDIQESEDVIPSSQSSTESTKIVHCTDVTVSEKYLHEDESISSQKLLGDILKGSCSPKEQITSDNTPTCNLANQAVIGQEEPVECGFDTAEESALKDVKENKEKNNDLHNSQNNQQTWEENSLLVSSDTSNEVEVPKRRRGRPKKNLSNNTAGEVASTVDINCQPLKQIQAVLNNGEDEKSGKMLSSSLHFSSEEQCGNGTCHNGQILEEKHENLYQPLEITVSVSSSGNSQDNFNQTTESQRSILEAVTDETSSIHLGAGVASNLTRRKSESNILLSSNMFGGEKRQNVMEEKKQQTERRRSERVHQKSCAGKLDLDSEVLSVNIETKNYSNYDSNSFRASKVTALGLIASTWKDTLDKSKSQLIIGSSGNKIENITKISTKRKSVKEIKMSHHRRSSPLVVTLMADKSFLSNKSKNEQICVNTSNDTNKLYKVSNKSAEDSQSKDLAEFPEEMDVCTGINNEQSLPVGGKTSLDQTCTTDVAYHDSGEELFLAVKTPVEILSTGTVAHNLSDISSATNLISGPCKRLSTDVRNSAVVIPTAVKYQDPNENSKAKDIEYSHEQDFSQSSVQDDVKKSDENFCEKNHSENTNITKDCNELVTELEEKKCDSIRGEKQDSVLVDRCLGSYEFFQSEQEQTPETKKVVDISPLTSSKLQKLTKGDRSGRLKSKELFSQTSDMNKMPSSKEKDLPSENVQINGSLEQFMPLCQYISNIGVAEEKDTTAVVEEMDDILKTNTDGLSENVTPSPQLLQNGESKKKAVIGAKKRKMSSGATTSPVVYRLILRNKEISNCPDSDRKNSVRKSCSSDNTTQVGRQRRSCRKQNKNNTKLNNSDAQEESSGNIDKNNSSKGNDNDKQHLNMPCANTDTFSQVWKEVDKSNASLDSFKHLEESSLSLQLEPHLPKEVSPSKEKTFKAILCHEKCKTSVLVDQKEVSQTNEISPVAVQTVENNLSTCSISHVTASEQSSLTKLCGQNLNLPSSKDNSSTSASFSKKDPGTGFSVSPLSRSQKILQAAIKNISGSPQNNNEKLRDKVQSNSSVSPSEISKQHILDSAYCSSPASSPPKWLKHVYSPTASPSAGILKKRVLKSGSPSSPSKQRKVSFAVPPVQSEVEFEVSPKKGRITGRVSRCLELTHGKNKSKSSPSDGKMFSSPKKMNMEFTDKDDISQSPATSSQSLQHSSEGYQSSPSLQINSQEPICSDLLDCPDHVELILHQLTSTIWARGLLQLIQAQNIKTIGEFSALTAPDIQKLPIISPKVETTRNVLNNYLLQWQKKNQNREDTLKTESGVQSEPITEDSKPACPVLPSTEPFSVDPNVNLVNSIDESENLYSEGKQSGLDNTEAMSSTSASSHRIVSNSGCVLGIEGNLENQKTKDISFASKDTIPQPDLLSVEDMLAEMFPDEKETDKENGKYINLSVTDEKTNPNESYSDKSSLLSKFVLSMSRENPKDSEEMDLVSASGKILLLDASEITDNKVSSPVNGVSIASSPLYTGITSNIENGKERQQENGALQSKEIRCDAIPSSSAASICEEAVKSPQKKLENVDKLWTLFTPQVIENLTTVEIIKMINMLSKVALARNTENMSS
ncbi:rap1 interacting factor 1 isoform X2 [Tachypleus tridentatus]|uniref:rap1 interacting factor 1 isoform X2 n=1 Tax=Tachypleus tridentatus TaxID=6853 RepID=UPI003FD411FE